MIGARRRALARVAAIALLVALVALEGCAGAPARDEEAARTAGGEATTAEERGYAEDEGASVAAPESIDVSPAMTTATGGAGAAIQRHTQAADPVVAVQRPEPTPWQGHEWALAPAVAPRVMLASVELPPGDAFRPPATACQDVILFVREGQLEATGTGVAPGDAPITMYPGDAARFGPEGDGLAVNVGATRARTVMAIARRAGSGAARVPPPEGDDCSVAARESDPLTRPLRVGSVATTPPLAAAGGRLEVRILLDHDGAGADHGALSWLEGTPDLIVPEHMHAGAAEILFVEEGEGTMRIGDREIAVRPGSAIYVPEDTLHSFRGAGTRPLRAIQIYAPGGAEQRFRGL